MVWLVAALALTLAVVVGVGVVALRMMHGAALRVASGVTPYDLEVTHADGEHITLHAHAPPPDLLDGGRFGLQWTGGYAQLGEIVERDGARVTRAYTLLEGAPPRAGARARIDTAAFPPHPTRAFGLEAESIRLDGPLGVLPAWLTAGDADTWVLAIHGKGAGRAEALRLVGPAARRGLPVMVASYRNDAGAPARASGRYGYGRDEWEDVEVALQAALERGARRIFLAGYSMGGAIATSFLARSPLAEHVCGLILDSPMLDFSATVEHGLRERGLPRPLSSVLRRVLAARYGIRRGELDYASTLAGCGLPVLLFQGDADRVVPYAVAAALAAAHSQHISLVTMPGVGHVRAWNSAPDQYERAIEAFLDRVGATSTATASDVGEVSAERPSATRARRGP